MLGAIFWGPTLLIGTRFVLNTKPSVQNKNSTAGELRMLHVSLRTMPRPIHIPEYTIIIHYNIVVSMVLFHYP